MNSTAQTMSFILHHRLIPKAKYQQIPINGSPYDGFQSYDAACDCWLYHLQGDCDYAANGVPTFVYDNNLTFGQDTGDESLALHQKERKISRQMQADRSPGDGASQGWCTH